MPAIFRQCTRKDGSGRSDTLLLTEGAFEEIFFPVGDWLSAGRLGDGLWKKPDGAIAFAIAEASCYFFLLVDTGPSGDGGFERPDAVTGGQRQARGEEPRAGCSSVSVHGRVGLLACLICEEGKGAFFARSFSGIAFGER